MRFSPTDIRHPETSTIPGSYGAENAYGPAQYAGDLAPSRMGRKTCILAHYSSYVLIFF